jgi:small-conductance mechanosensitive channel
MTWAERWKQTVLDSLSALGAKVGGFLPNLIGTIVILIVGWLVSKGACKLATVVLQRVGFDRLAEKVGIAPALERANVKATASELIGKLVFWFFMLTFFISATETLGLENVSQTINSFVAYLPNVIAAAVVLVIGLAIAGFVRDLVRSGAEGIGAEYAGPLGSLAYGVLLVVTASLAVGQLQIETDLIDRIIEIVLLATAAALTLALGLGTRDLARQVVAGVYARDLFEPGTEIAVDDEKGVLVEVGAVNACIRKADGDRAYVPNARLTETVVRASGDGRSGKKGTDE